MKFSIICPVYNSEKYLPECIESVINQTFHEWELIVINDGSSDGSFEVLKKYQTLYSDKIKVFNKENGGVSSARNFGLKKVSGDYILFVDSDDLLSKRCLEYYASLLKNDDYDLIWASFSCKEKQSTYLIREKEVSINDCLNRFKALGSSAVWGKCFKKSSLENLFFDEAFKYGEDSLFFINFLLNRCHSVLHSKNEVYFYRPNSESATHIRSFQKSYQYFKIRSMIVDLYEEHRKGKELIRSVFCTKFEAAVGLKWYFCKSKTLMPRRLNEEVNNSLKFRFKYLLSFRIPLIQRFKIFLISLCKIKVEDN